MLSYRLTSNYVNQEVSANGYASVAIPFTNIDGTLIVTAIYGDTNIVCGNRSIGAGNTVNVDVHNLQANTRTVKITVEGIVLKVGA